MVVFDTVGFTLVYQFRSEVVIMKLRSPRDVLEGAISDRFHYTLPLCSCSTVCVSLIPLAVNFHAPPFVYLSCAFRTQFNA